MGSYEPPLIRTRERRAEHKRVTARNERGSIEIIDAVTVPRWKRNRNRAAWAGVVVAALVPIWLYVVPPVLKAAFEKAVAEAGAPHMAKAQVEHQSLHQEITANGVEHQVLKVRVDGLEQREAQQRDEVLKSLHEIRAVTLETQQQVSRLEQAVGKLQGRAEAQDHRGRDGGR